MSITHFIRSVIRLIMRAPRAGALQAREEERLINASRGYTTALRDLAQEIADIDQQIQDKQEELGRESRHALRDLLQAQLHSLQQALDRRKQRIGLITDHRERADLLLLKLGDVRLVAGPGAVSLGTIDTIAQEFEHAKLEAQDLVQASRLLENNNLATEYQLPMRSTTSLGTDIHISPSRDLTAPTAVSRVLETPPIVSETETGTNNK